MKKQLFLFAALSFFAAKSTFAQIQDEANVTITMDLQPVLQLEMTTPDQIDFTFNEIKDYYAGITKYGGTILKVNASVDWDLWAVGTSNDGTYWDVPMTYNSVAGSDIPLEALELHQVGANADPGAATNFDDYNNAFIFSSTILQQAVPYVPTGQNCIYASATPYTMPADGNKFIQGGNGAGFTANAGSWLTAFPADGQGNAAPLPGTVKTPASAGALAQSPWYNVIDYRIVPGLPATFPFSSDNAAVAKYVGGVVGTAAKPGVYTMNVKYILVENQ